MKVPKGRCVIIDYPSNVIIMENMDVYEIYDDDPHDVEESYVRKLPMKADIDFDEYYGDDGKANWCNDHLPVVEEDGKLIWDY